MDPRRFDALVRAWPAPGSRRRLLRLLVGSILIGRWPPTPPATAAARAHRAHGPLAVNCRGAGPKDGGNPEPQSCGTTSPAATAFPPHGCCPTSSCLRRSDLQPVKGKQRGFCYCDDGFVPDIGPDSANFPFGYCAAATFLQSFQVCGPGDHCSQNFDCDFNNVPPYAGAWDGPDFYCGWDCAVVDQDKPDGPCATHQPGVPRCCRAEGYDCDTDCWCCGDLRCQFLFHDAVGDHWGCLPPPPPSCHTLGQACADGQPCCAGNGSCQGGQCCLADGAASGAVCLPNGPCVGCCAGTCDAAGRCGTTASCVAVGAPCLARDQCCQGAVCQTGRCTLPSPCVSFLNVCTVGGTPCCDDVPCFEGRCRTLGARRPRRNVRGRTTTCPGR